MHSLTTHGLHICAGILIPRTINRDIKTREGEKRKKTGIPAEDSSHNRDSFRIERMRGPAGAASDIHIGRSPVRNPGNTLLRSIDSGLAAGPKQAANTEKQNGLLNTPYRLSAVDPQHNQKNQQQNLKTTTHIGCLLVAGAPAP